MDEFERKLQAALKRGIPGEAGALVDATWLDEAELDGKEWRYRIGGDEGEVAGIVLGYRNGQSVGSMDNRHVLTVAGSRGGKGVSLIIPNLLKYDGSVLAIDPKGELARITARARREKGQKVVILDPFDTTKLDGKGAFNPLSEIDIASPNVIDDAGQVADALIVANERDPHWTDSARILIKGLILFALTRPEGERHLVTVWELLTGTHAMMADVIRRSEGETTGRQALFALMQANTAFGGAIAATGRQFAQMADRERESVFSTALTQLEFLSSTAMRPTLTGNDLSLTELKTGKVTLFLCLPATRMGTHARWLRVIINLALIAFERTEARLRIPVLMVLDEFPVLGHMKSVETAAGLMAGFGVKLWVVLQDLTQVKRLYRDSWETFIGNAGIATFWANSDKTTLDYMSDKLGQTGVRLTHSNDITAQQRFSGATGTREELRVQRLAAPHELEQMLERKENRVLVLAAGKAPVVLERIIYYDDSNLVGLFDSIPR